MTRHWARTLTVISLILTLGVGVSACSSAGESTTPSQASASTGAPASASASESTQASESPSSEPSFEGPVTVSFLTPVPKPTWGASFNVEAEATDGSAIAYSAEGDCSVDATSGKVKAESVGTCKITAHAVDADPPAAATLAFKVTKADPVIHFSDATTRFARPFLYKLKVTVTPKIPLKMVVVHGATGGEKDDSCTIQDNSALVFKKTPTADDFPDIPATCVVKISATATKNYNSPKSISRKIRIELAAFDVNVPEEITVSYSADAGVKKFTARESSGAAFGIDISQLSGDGGCQVSVKPFPAKAKTKVYTATATVDEPDADGYDCVMKAQAIPPDYQGGKFDDEFTIHVVP
jgi:hypothetical protein